MHLLLALAQAAPVPGPALHVGDSAYSFSLPAINEDAAMKAVARPHVALSDYTGIMPGFPASRLVVEFVQKKGSEGTLAAMERLNKKYSKDGVRFVAIVAGGGEIATLSGWVEAQRLSFPVLNDEHGIVVSRYGIPSYPMTFVMDTTGDVQAIGVANAELETSLDAILAAP